MVSVSNPAFATTVSSALPYINYLFLNELEAAKLCEVPANQGDKLNIDQLKGMALKIKQMGVRDGVILHFPQGALAIDNNEKCTMTPSLELPSGYLKGNAGAGDAFAAGFLFGLHENLSLDKCLNYGICSAVASLGDESCSEGVSALENVLLLGAKFPLRQF